MSSPKTYSGPDLLQIAMPMGGIGAGCICLNGVGGFQDYSIRHKPNTTAEPDAFDPTVGVFATIHIANGPTRLVEGPIPPEKIYDQGLQGQGFRKVGHEGLPRFRSAEFTNRYPFGIVTLSDPRLPVTVEIEGWNPFIPLDAENSGIPCAVVSYSIANRSAEPVEFELAFHSTHLARGSGGEKGTRNEAIPGRGVFYSNTDDPSSASFGSGAIAVVSGNPKIKAMWFRGGWFDSISALWREVSAGTFAENDGSLSKQGLEGNNGGSILVGGRLEAGEQARCTFVVAWHFPNCDRIIGQIGDQPVNLAWHPFYATLWKDAREVAAYVCENFDSLRSRTAAFEKALASSTLPETALDAVRSNLAILKSPTVLRQSSGNLWAWEGCCTDRGCCHGSCTHVWNYAQAMPHLFPALERTLREQEYLRSMDDRGHVNFRSALPDAKTTHDFHAASDGQLGGILKLYRDWQISGDTDWLRDLYPLAKRSLDFCIAAWDPDRRGALFEPHHNTYDIEFWGPDGMCSSIYIGALGAMAKIGHALGKDEDAQGYEELAKRGAELLDAELFNGEYYEQRVQWEGLRDASFAESIKGEPKDEMARLLKTEGPKYQYGTGCLADGVIGAWMAAIYGVETPLSQSHIRSHLSALFRHNFKRDLSEHACTQRPGYAMGTESGLLLCTWPRGDKPTLPFVYSDEVWTGIEYQ
ncbi:MAG TPA: GH116 family glycosyl hydrolase, partial [Fimbriimonadaceae bacterium]|nr:GH116 family glycosyl hydrolase [Fimbriimonadaceae bacterium]